MKKIISFLVLASLIAPLFVNAVMIVPSVNITVIVKTEGEDNSFNFKVQYPWEECFYDEETDIETCANIWEDYYDFSLNTENYIAEESFPINSWSEYKIFQEPIDGFEISNISCESDNSENDFFYQDGGVIFTPISWSSIICTFTNNKIDTKNPVLIVPGIMGTELENSDGLLWLNFSKMLFDIGDEFLDVLKFDSGITPVNNITTGEVLKNPSGIFDYIEGLINEFEDQGYTENQDLFLFPYDWRYGVSGKYADGKTNVDLLAEKMGEILAQTGADKIDVVAHSNGGLLVKKYVMENPESHNINKAIFVGVPNTGAVKAVKNLLQGDNFKIPWLADSEIKEISQNMPVAYDLLPSQEYYNDAGSFVSLINYGTAGNPTIENDLDYSEFKSYLNDKGLNSTAMENSESLHTSNFDNYDLRDAGVDLYNITGCKTATLTNFIESRVIDYLGNEHISYGKIYLDSGDGTVPAISATNLPVDSANQFYVLKTDHSGLLSADGSRQKIVNLISGSSLDVGSKITQDSNQCPLIGKVVSVFSPVDIKVTDQNGNELKIADDQSITNQIAGADFEIWGEHKFVFLPTDENQDYTINLMGTDTGTFTIKSEDIQDSQTTKTEIFSNIPVTSELTGQINFGENDQVTTLTVKESETANEITILPSSIVDELQSEDMIAPTSEIKLLGKLEKIKIDKIGKGKNKEKVYKEDVYKGKVEVEIKAKDYVIESEENKTSGVLEISYNVDNSDWHKIVGDNAEFSVCGDGGHTIIYFSTDNAGNNEIAKEISFTIEKSGKNDKCDEVKNKNNNQNKNKEESEKQNKNAGNNQKNKAGAKK